MNRWWLVLLVALLYGHAAIASDRATLAKEDLSGTWTGVHRGRQLGKCPWESGKLRVVFELAARSNGEFLMTHVPSRPSADQNPMVFTGRITNDLEVVAVFTKGVKCGDVERTLESDYRGSFTKKKKRIVLELTGTEALCPEMDCEFEMRFRLEKKLSPGSDN